MLRGLVIYVNGDSFRLSEGIPIRLFSVVRDGIGSYVLRFYRVAMSFDANDSRVVQCKVFLLGGVVSGLPRSISDSVW